MDVVAAGLCALAILAIVAALRTRARRLRPSDVVVIDGIPHVLVAVETNLNAPTSYAFEGLGEYLARKLMVGDEHLTLGELLAREGWQPPRSPWKGGTT